MKSLFVSLLVAVAGHTTALATSPPPPYITPTDFVIECQAQRVRTVGDQQRSLLAVLSFKRSDLTSFGGVTYEFPSANIWRDPQYPSSATSDVPFLTDHRMYLRILRSGQQEKFQLDLVFKSDERRTSAWGEPSNFDRNSIASATVGSALMQNDSAVVGDHLLVLCQRIQ